jgi:hypothetical protein
MTGQSESVPAIVSRTGHHHCTLGFRIREKVQFSSQRTAGSAHQHKPGCPTLYRLLISASYFLCGAAFHSSALTTVCTEKERPQKEPFKKGMLTFGFFTKYQVR